MKAAIHLGQDYNDNLVAYRNTNCDALEMLFDITQILILNQKHEILNVSTIEWQSTLWMRSTLLHDNALKLANTKVHVYSDSVLCLEWMHGHPGAKEKWKDHSQYFQASNGYIELSGIAGEPFELEWNIFPGHTTLQILKEIPVIKTVRPSMSVFNDIAWTKKGKSNECFSNSEKVKRFGGKISFGTLVFSRSKRRTNMIWNARLQT